jgi:hypothetical protein
LNQDKGQPAPPADDLIQDFNGFGRSGFPIPAQSGQEWGIKRLAEDSHRNFLIEGYLDSMGFTLPQSGPL